MENRGIHAPDETADEDESQVHVHPFNPPPIVYTDEEVLEEVPPPPPPPPPPAIERVSQPTLSHRRRNRTPSNAHFIAFDAEFESPFAVAEPAAASLGVVELQPTAQPQNDMAPSSAIPLNSVEPPALLEPDMLV